MTIKTALDINRSSVARLAATGALAGGGTAAILNLIHMLRNMNEERKRLQGSIPETDEDTIVLTIPPKAGSDEPNVPGAAIGGAAAGATPGALLALGGNEIIKEIDQKAFQGAGDIASGVIRNSTTKNIAGLGELTPAQAFMLKLMMKARKSPGKAIGIPAAIMGGLAGLNEVVRASRPPTPPPSAMDGIRKSVSGFIDRVKSGEVKGKKQIVKNEGTETKETNITTKKQIRDFDGQYGVKASQVVASPSFLSEQQQATLADARNRTSRANYVNNAPAASIGDTLDQARTVVGKPRMRGVAPVLTAPPSSVNGYSRNAGQGAAIGNINFNLNSMRNSTGRAVSPGGSGRSALEPPPSSLNMYVKKSDTMPWPTLTAGALSLIAGTAAGAHLVNKIYEKRVERILKAKLEAAQNEYMTALTQKTGSAVDDLFDQPTVKRAAPGLFNMLNYPIAAAVLMALAGTGGTAYITKKVLDEKLRDQEGKGDDIPKMKRIIFRSADGQEDVKTAADEEIGDLDVLEAVLAVTVDKIASTTKILTQPDVTAELNKSGMNINKMFKLADDISDIYGYLKSPGQTGLRRAIQRAYMGQYHPNFKWALKLPGAGRIADKKMYAKIEDLFPALKPKLPSAVPAPGQVMLDPDIVTLSDDLAKYSAEKYAFKSPFTRELITSALGSEVAGTNDASSQQQALIAALQQHEADKAEQAKTPEDVASTVRISATDSDAVNYVMQNKERIKRILVEMARNKMI